MTNIETARAEINAAIGAHGTWKMHLQAATLTGELTTSAAQLARDDVCQFGKWLRTLPPEMARSQEAQNAVHLHRQFHDEAGRVARLIEAGDLEAAKAQLGTGTLQEISKALALDLTGWRMALLRAA